jgi:hypothetical protein
MEGRSNCKTQKSSVLSSVALVVVSLTAVAAAAQLYADGQHLQAFEKARAALETNAKNASDRASKAESGRAAAEASLNETKSARATAEASLAKARQEKDDAALALSHMREQLAIAEVARRSAEDKLQAASAELTKLESANKSLESGAASAQKDLERERAATQAAALTTNAARVDEAVVSPETTGSTPISPSPIFVPTSTRSNAAPATQTTSTKDEVTRMEDCMAVWEPATHMTKAEWRRTCKDTLNVDF